MGKATAFPETVWHGEVPGATQAANNMLDVKFVNVSVVDAMPLPFVTALGGFSDPVPSVIRKFAVTPPCAAPWPFTTLAVSGMFTELPEAIHK
jgi:hypothetical protein